ncbi:hypothetical protein MNBD_BACTEROID01-1911 [hydrothermal vent metagenome]|uniref:Peptidase M6-like domain-containing protein n=1 Tax=hydrothermal vent metagenome TaxID=652676 RepID=A0A3B0U980_9ZZZZ
MRKVIVICFMLAGFYCSGQLSYVPASPYPITVKQPDGTSLTVLAKGDEYSHYAVTEDGYSVVRNRLGIYEYAEKNFVGNLAPSGVKARNKGERAGAERTYIQHISKNIRPTVSVLNKILKSISTRNGIQLFPTSGDRRVLLLLIAYKDLPNTYSLQDFDDLMNKGNYQNTGSFSDYYKTYSNNTLNLSVDVFGWYVSKENYLYYGDDNGSGRVRVLVREAIDSAENAGVDFSVYDNDGDGKLDNLMVVHAGPGAEEGSQTQYAWSHSWNLWDLAVTYDNVLINDYIVQPETRSYGMVGIGVFCHEFGHALGLPDLYDTNEGSEGLGNWCLMASGSWLGKESKPAGFSAWCREELSWVSPVEISAYGDYTLLPAATSTECYKILTPKANEYFLLENRYRTQFDSYLPGSGLAIFHINTSQAGNTDENNKLSDLEEADGKDDLDNEVNRGDAGDIFPGSSNNTAFNDFTYPGAQTYNLSKSGVSIKNIDLNGQVIHFSIGDPEIQGVNLTYDSLMNNFTVDGAQVNISLEVENTGTEASGPFSIGYYLSPSAPVSTSGILLGYNTYSGLSAGASINETFSSDITTIPSLPVGDYYVGYIIDYQGQVDEIEEGDNLYTHATGQVLFNYLANLSYDSQKNSLQIDGGIVTVSLEVENNGSSAAASCRVGYYLSPDPEITSSDYLVDTDVVGVLLAGGTSSEGFSANIPTMMPSLPAGKYYVGYIVDFLEVIDEENEKDNTFYFPGQAYSNCPEISTVVSESICEGDSIEFNGSFYKTAGSYEFTYTGQYGCDSIVTLDLIVNPSHNILVEKTICQGDSVVIGASVYKTTGAYEDMFVNRFGCDSLVTLNLTVNPVYDTVLSIGICEGDSALMGGDVYKEPGVYSAHLPSRFGCDSLVTLYLSVYPKPVTTLFESICEGDSIVIGSSVYKQSGIFSNTFTSQYGCDSIVTLGLTVNPVYDTTLFAVVCQGESYYLGGQAYSSGGIYTHNFPSRYGCDSLVTVNLTVAPLPHVSLGNDTFIFSSDKLLLDAGPGYEAYNWGTGEATQIIEINKNLGLGENEVDVTVTDQNNCSGSGRIMVTIYDGSTSPNDKDPMIKLFPNPTSGMVNILLEQVYGKYEVRVVSDNGSTVFSKKYIALSGKVMNTLNLGSLSPGLYTVMVISGSGVNVDKLVIQR